MARSETTIASLVHVKNGSRPIGHKVTDLEATDLGVIAPKVTANKVAVLKATVLKATANKLAAPRATAKKATSSKPIAPRVIGARALPERNAAGFARSAASAKSRTGRMSFRTHRS